MESPGNLGGGGVGVLGEAEKDEVFVSIHHFTSPSCLLGVGLRLNSL